MAGAHLLQERVDGMKVPWLLLSSWCWSADDHASENDQYVEILHEFCLVDAPTLIRQIVVDPSRYNIFGTLRIHVTALSFLVYREVILK